MSTKTEEGNFIPSVDLLQVAPQSLVCCKQEEHSFLVTLQLLRQTVFSK